MANYPSKIPTSRLSRFGQVASLATKIGSNVVSEGAKHWLKGQRPTKQDLLFTSLNITHVADQLAHLRGAAMKIGQMLSMDAGDILPPEMAELLSRLRANANPMLTTQLAKMMEEGLGSQWKSHFLSFNFSPIASASIGQVHFAYTDAGDPVAVKVQYPGIRESIDSDIDNVAALLRLVGLIPEHVDIKSLLSEAKQQLHDEADYRREAKLLLTYRKHLEDDVRFIVPDVHSETSTDTILTMSFVQGRPIEELVSKNQATRDTCMSAMVSLLLKEMFAFKLVQTDPNFANYLFNDQTNQIILLDFGATRTMSSQMSIGYQHAFKAVLDGDDESLEQALLQIGFFSQAIDSSQKNAVLNIVKLVCEPMLDEQGYDFGNSDLHERVRQAGTALTLKKTIGIRHRLMPCSSTERLVDFTCSPLD